MQNILFLMHPQWRQWVLVLVLLPLFSHNLTGQHFTAEETKADLRFLKQSIQQYNPGLPYYALKFNKQADSLISETKEPLSPLLLYSKASQLCALSNEAHFNIGSWQDSVHIGFLNNTYRYLPISIKLVGQRIFIWKDYSQERATAPQWEIKSINGKSARQVVQQLYRCIPADGRIIPYLNQKIAPNFNWLYYLHIAQPDTFAVTVQAYGLNEKPVNQLKEVKIAALTRKEMFKVALARNLYDSPKEPPPGPDQVYQFYLTDSLNGKSLATQVALLKLNSFNWQKVKDNRIKAKKLYKEIFKYLHKNNITQLVIDLRNNSGGRKEFAHKMVPYLLPKDFETEDPLQTSYLWNGKVKKYKMPKRSRYAFEGEVYVLINGGTFSNASVLARFLKEFANATLIGSETGSRYHGFTAGSKQKVTLPNSGLSIGIPRAHLRMPVAQKQNLQNRGVLPHNPINYLMADYILGYDLEMRYVGELIKRNNKTKAD